jgi:putative flippase GtrA
MPKEKITLFIDLFYPMFRRVMPLQTFRYAACGGSNMALGFLTYIIVYHLVHKHVVDIGIYSFEPYSFALFISGCQTFLIGFFLNKYVVFIQSNLKGRIQLFRYLLSFLFNFCLNYVLLKGLIVYLKMNAVVAQMLVTIIIVAISYLTQRHFTFRVKKVA